MKKILFFILTMIIINGTLTPLIIENKKWMPEVSENKKSVPIETAGGPFGLFQHKAELKEITDNSDKILDIFWKTNDIPFATVKINETETSKFANKWEMPFATIKSEEVLSWIIKYKNWLTLDDNFISLINANKGKTPFMLAKAKDVVEWIIEKKN